MQWLSADALKNLGGLTGVANLLHAPVSTVNSWKRIGIPASRLEHLKLAAQAAKKQIDWATALRPIDAAPEQAAA